MRKYSKQEIYLELRAVISRYDVPYISTPYLDITNDLGMDSVDILDLWNDIQLAYNISIPPSVAASAILISDIVDIVHNQVNKQ